jgi:hypothetical protein
MQRLQQKIRHPGGPGHSYCPLNPDIGFGFVLDKWVIRAREAGLAERSTLSCCRRSLVMDVFGAMHCRTRSVAQCRQEVPPTD